MTGIVWDPSLETGDAMIDAQHKHLFALVNDLRNACVENRGSEATTVVLGELGAYVTDHFAAEQALMIRSHYPVDAMVDHLSQHRALTERTTEIASQHQRGELTTVLPLAEFLHEWLRTHIRKTDRALVDYVRALEA